MKIQEIQVTMVKPLRPTSAAFLPLSQFDTRYMFHRYMQMVAFYPGQRSEPEIDSLIFQAKLCLSDVLVHFYPMAGRLAFSDEEEQWGIQCNDAGVEWIVAKADTDLAELDCSQPSSEFSALICNGKYGDSAQPLGSPLLSIQVTKFLCGGISVAWAADHAVADGTSRVHFLVSWAQICLGRKISRFPCIDRTVSPQQQKQTSADHHSSEANEIVGELDVSMKIFLFDEDYLNKLKQMASTEFSRFVLLNAHIWINMTAARNLPASQRIRISVAANCRHRMLPRLPEEYFGNAVLQAVAETTVGELLDGGLQYAANLLRHSIQGLNMQSLQDKLSGTLADDSLVGKNSNMFSGSSQSFRYYDIDLGWGMPAAVRHVGLEKLGLDGLCMFNPSPRSSRDIEVTISLPSDTMHRLTNSLLDLGR